jgi:hypothetical protein
MLSSLSAAAAAAAAKDCDVLKELQEPYSKCVGRSNHFSDYAQHTCTRLTIKQVTDVHMQASAQEPTCSLHLMLLILQGQVPLVLSSLSMAS